MASKQKILIVDDDTNIAELISLYLTKECYEVQIVEDGERALQIFDSFAPNLVLLDLMLPGMDGYQVCREIRSRSNTPIIMLSAKGEVFDKVLGLELGADDYMEKPFSLPVLYAKVQALLRRAKGYVRDAALHAPGVTLDLRTGLVTVDGRETDLPPKEFALLRLLMENPGGLLPREALLTRVWGWDYDGSDRVVDNRIKNLRRALGPYAGYIRTVFKTGYRWEAERHEN